ncbi:MAG: glycosyltransferase family 39 protein [Thermoanaerobaculia bacterium]|nr:glycosyltransferase family 39 protein [Thermoanaerobaculia bacterium]
MSAPSKAVPRGASPPGPGLRLFFGASLLLVTALLAAGQWILNVRTWTTPASRVPLWVDRLGSSFPAATTFPPHANVALAAFALAGLLFGGLVALRASPDTLFDPTPMPPSLAGWHALKRPAGFLPVLVFLVAEGRVLQQASRAEDVSPIPFFIATAALLVTALAVDRAGPTPLPALRRLLPRLAYPAGILALLVALAAGHARRPAVLAIAAGAAAILLVVALRGLLREEGADRAALVLMPFLCAGSFLLFSYGMDSWAWSFLGDEYAFHDAAKALLDGGIPWTRLLSGAGAYGYHPVASSAPPAVTMLLLGRDAYGWKVAHAFLLALSLLPLHAFARRFLGQTSGLLVAALCGASNALLSFAKLGSNNAQAVFFLSLCLWAAVKALERGLFTYWVLAGFAVGGGFYTFGIARTFSLVVAFLVLVYAVRRGGSHARMLAGVVALVGTSILVALPVLSTRSAWVGQVGSTVFGLDLSPEKKLALLASNTKHGALGFLVNQRPGVFTFGPLADPLTGSLALLGLAALVFGLARMARARAALLGSAFLLVVFLAGVQQYEYPNITRTFALAPVWALLAGVGFTAVAGLFGRPGRAAAVAATLVAAIVTLLGVFMCVDLSQRQLEQPPIAVILETAQRTALPDRSGPLLHVVAPHDYRFWVDSLYRVFGVPSSRYRVFTPAEALASEELCRAEGAAVFVMLAVGDPRARERGDAAAEGGASALPTPDAILSRISTCWQGSTMVAVKDGLGRVLVYRALTPAALPYVHSVPGRLVEEPILPSELIEARSSNRP